MGTGGRSVVVALALGLFLVALEARGEEGGLVLVFDASAERLPQAEIRAAVEKELGRPLAGPGETGASELGIAVDPVRGLVVRYRTERGSLERYLPMPTEVGDVPRIVSLAVGNLARDQSSVVGQPRPVEEVPTTLTEQQPPPPKPPEPVPAREPTPVSPAPAKPPRRHWVGLHVAQDIAIIGGSNVCDANKGQKADNYACFYEGSSDEPFLHTPYPHEDGIESGPVLATTRVLFSYDAALVPMFSLGARVGFAFGGGPAAGQEPVETAPGSNLNLLPARTKGRGGTPFMPAHLELRANLWFLPLDRRPLSVYVGAGFGAAQVDAKTTVVERDCAQTLGADWDAAQYGDYDDCRAGDTRPTSVDGDPAFDWQELPETRIDAWKKMGQGFVSASTGGMLAVSDRVGAVLNVNFMFMLPANGIVVEPSLGAVLNF
jgi:hypothetical protein